MKISKYLASSVVRIIKDEDSDDQKRFYIGDLANGLKDRYKFLQAPTRIEEFNLEKGVEFIHGLFNESLIIGKFRVHNNGVYCEADLPTEVISEFLEDVFSWARQEIGMTVEDANLPNIFFRSNLEVETDISLAPAHRKFSAIGDKLTALLASYGHQVPPFQASQLGFHCDVSGGQNVRPDKFLFERRDQQPFDSGLFFSAAPLMTTDHLALLNELESILAS